VWRTGNVLRYRKRRMAGIEGEKEKHGVERERERER